MPIYILDVSAVKYNFCVEKIVGKLAFFSDINEISEQIAFYGLFLV